MDTRRPLHDPRIPFWCFPPPTPTSSIHTHLVCFPGHEKGHCVLCLHIALQNLLDKLYAANIASNPNHPYRCRQDDPKAALFPLIKDDGSIHFGECVSTHQLTRYVRATIEKANTLRAEPKDPSLYTTHSNKVGGAFKAADRGMNLHEGQRFSLHTSAHNFALYGMLLEKFEAGHTVVKMQQPSLASTHHIHSTRQLQGAAPTRGMIPFFHYSPHSDSPPNSGSPRCFCYHQTTKGLHC